MRRVAFKEEFIYLASTHGETRCLSAGDVLEEEEEDSKNSTDNRSDDREDILEEGTDDDMVDEEGIDLQHKRLLTNVVQKLSATLCS